MAEHAGHESDEVRIERHSLTRLLTVSSKMKRRRAKQTSRVDGDDQGEESNIYLQAEGTRVRHAVKAPMFCPA
nr:hypothetical protein CFP56_30026 [Quercus suber]